MIGSATEWSATGRLGVSLAEFSAVNDVAFAFKRALSRLMEMQGAPYREAHRRRFYGANPAPSDGYNRCY